MKFTIQNKIVLANIVIIVMALAIIGTLVIQGMLYYNIQHTEKLLVENSNSSNLFIQQDILSRQEDNASANTIFKNNSTFLVEELSKQNNTRVQLFDQFGVLLADSTVLDTSPPTDTRQEVEIAIDKGEKAYVVKKLKEGRFIYFASPIIINNNQIGVISFLYSLEDVDKLIQQSVVLFLWAGLVGLFVMYFVSFLLTKRILKPVYSLRDSSEKIAKGNYLQQITYISHDEIGDLTKSFNQMVINIRAKIHEAKAEKLKLESVLSSIQDGVIAVDHENNLLTLNDPAKDLFHMKNQDEFECILSYPFMQDLYHSVQREKRASIKEVNHNNRVLLIYANLILIESKSIGYIFVIRDITKIRELEEKQSQFISSVSHELRTPLTTIIGYSDLLKRRGTENPELLEKSLDTIVKEGNRLLRLVDDLLNLSKLENMEFDLVITQIDIVQLVEDVVTQMRIKSKKYNNDIQFSHSPIPKINGDYDRLKQVFINIIDNSIKYSKNGARINVFIEQEEDLAVISIRDHGPGIPQEDIDKIFKPFYRVDKVRTRKMGGSGLGLSIVKEIVEKHGGEVTIESIKDEGTLIMVKLPMS